MFCFSTAFQNIKKQKVRSILTVSVFVVLALFFFLYLGNIRHTEEQMAELADALPVKGYVTTLDGAQVAGLQISETLLESMKTYEGVKDLQYTILIVGQERNTMHKDVQDLMIMGTNDIRAVADVETENDFSVLSTDQDVCIASERLIEQRGWKIGQEICLDLFYSEFEKHGRGKANYPLATHTFQIVGSIATEEVNEERQAPDLLLPAETLHQIFRQEGKEFVTDSLAFTVKEPMQLNAVKEKMQEMNLLPISQNASSSTPRGISLVLQDANFISAAERLMQQKDIMESFFAPILLLVFFTGVVISYLMVQGRKEELLLYRLLGLSKKQTVSIFFIEQMILLLSGTVIGCTVVAICNEDWEIGAFVCGISAAGFLAGTILGACKTARISVMKLKASEW